ncbi:alpha/beta hydrolase [Mycobacterium sp.]|uniref:alpha/beta fold hydrolase n=1 Tax=Mycobacterium sp. TaxID=1785 RepID=UPI002B62046E|nr:alpha/beta hydrolase [Mycobacterium sp.]HKP41239.1 alpha/beta hydrolase [Mycobacterium sp.]
MSHEEPAQLVAASAERYGGACDAAWRRIDWPRYGHTLIVAGARLRFVDTGSDGAPVLLLHGHGSTWQYWLETIALLSNAGRRVIAVDLPGFGDSQAHSFSTASMPGMVDALCELLNGLGITRSDVVGHSFGTIVAIELAVGHAHRINTLTLAGGPASSIVSLFQRPLHTAIRQPRLALTVLGDMCTAGLPIPVWLRRLAARRVWLRRLAFSSYVARPADLPADLAENLMLGVGAPAYFHLPLKARGFAPVPMHQLRCPVLVVNGDRDAFVPVADVASFLRAVPHACHHTIKGAGHLVTVEYPATFVELLNEFCSSVGGNPPASAVN